MSAQFSEEDTTSSPINETICALATAPGISGIAVIRISGPQALRLGRRICPFLPVDLESHRVYYGMAKDSTDQPIDEVLTTYFAEGRSFSGEDTVEISCHGGYVLPSLILNELVQLGARTARRGEFTYRAFMNGRVDLVQAESVHTLIESQSKQSAKLALRQLQGRLSAEFERIENDLLWILAQLEASIDFSSDGIEISPSLGLLPRTESLICFTRDLLRSYEDGRVLQNGFIAALIGAPNVGKSSLLNALLNEDRAIVTPHAGTTRDLVEGRLSYGGIGVTVVDTAGIRPSIDEVERMGIERSIAMMEKADFIFHVFDLGSSDCKSSLLSLVEGSARAQASVLSAGNRFSRCYFIFNKMDIDPDERRWMECRDVLAAAGLSERAIRISAVDRRGIEKIDEVFLEMGKSLNANSGNVILQTRHFEVLQRISQCLIKASKLMASDSSPEFIAFELQEAIRGIHELLGKTFDEQVIDRIFKEFCLGK